MQSSDASEKRLRGRDGVGLWVHRYRCLPHFPASCQCVCVAGLERPVICQCVCVAGLGWNVDKGVAMP
jgi:hypothetical protein